LRKLSLVEYQISSRSVSRRTMNVYKRMFVYTLHLFDLDLRAAQDQIDLDYIIRKYPDDFGKSRRRDISNPYLSSRLLRAHRLLFNEPNAADVQFICSRGTGGHDEYIYAHSITLSVSSEYFKTSKPRVSVYLL
jgi:hypothetical protein